LGLIKEGKIQNRETLCFLTDIENKRAKLDIVKVGSVEKLIKSFLSQAPKEIADAKKLAEALATRAKLLKDFLLEELERQEKEHTEGRLYQLYETFKSFVFHELTVDEFADAFAQNLVYGLFLAKLNADVYTVSLYNAKRFIPASFELIRELVNFLDELDNEEYRETRWIVEEVLTIMNNLNLAAIQDSLSFTTKKKDSDGFTIKDPYVYFYENFLASYDKKLRKAKGVYYTPPPVVNFIVRAIDDILINTFKIKDGFQTGTK
jgi:type I restriction-modification system DNA methylase subunit